MIVDDTRTLEQFRAGDFAAWRGLSPGCDRATVERVLPPLVAGEAFGVLGLGLPRHFRLVGAPAYPRGVRLWLDADRIVALQAELPRLPRLDEVLTTWGEPDARLDFEIDVLQLPGAEWVYAQRGLSAAINPDTGATLQVVAFVPTTLERYLAEIRPPGGVREHPE